MPKLEDGPWPAFPADVMSTTIVAATQCSGMLLVFEKMFESRLFFVDKLIGMGARIVLCDPHRAVISGPVPLKGGTVESPDIRAGMAMLLAALAAEGPSTIHNIGPDRAGLRADRRAAARPGRRDRAGGWTGERGPGATPALASPRSRTSPVRDPEWRADGTGVVAGITGRGAEPGRGLRSGPLERGAGRRDDAPLAGLSPRHARVHGGRSGQSGPRGRVDDRVHPARGWIQVEGIDGWVTTTPGVLLTVTVADCIPGLSRRPGRGVALLHAGWRGTAGGILGRGVERLLRRAGAGPLPIS